MGMATGVSLVLIFFLAPEVIRNSSLIGYSFGVDWWSLGVSAYEMLRGEVSYMQGDVRKEYLTF